MSNSTIESDQEDEKFNISDFYLLIFCAFTLIYVIAIIVLIIKVNMPVNNDYLGAIDENKNLDIGLYIRNHRQIVRAMRECRQIPQDVPSWPENVVLPYRPWDNENQVPIY